MTVYEKSKQEIIKTLNNMRGKYNIYEIWKDFITISAVAISNEFDKTQYEKRENVYLQTIKKYDKKEIDQFVKMMGLTRIGLESGQMGDFLGEIYMNLEVSNKEVGQFFTPYNISRLTAELASKDIEDKITRINEPSCGSGGMIIAYADVMKRKGINYHEKLRVVCNDLDYDVVKMAYIQLSILGIDAVIMQGNTLTLEMGEVWYTPMHIVNFVREKTEAEKNAKYIFFFDLKENEHVSK